MEQTQVGSADLISGDGMSGEDQMGIKNWIAKIRGRNEIDCPEVRELSSDYLEDDLAPSSRTKIASHLSICPSCTAFIRSLASTIALLGKLPRSKPPPSLKQNIRDRVENRK